jgi:hypothetical protein
MKTNTYAFAGSPLVIAGCAFAAAEAAETCAFMNSGASTVMAISISQEVIVLSIARSNTVNEAFNNSAYHCATALSHGGRPADPGPYETWKYDNSDQVPM